GADRAEEASRAATGCHCSPGREPRGEGPPTRLGPDKVLHGSALQWISRRSCEPTRGNRLRARATHQGSLAVPSSEGSQGMTVGRDWGAGGGPGGSRCIPPTRALFSWPPDGSVSETPS